MSTQPTVSVVIPTYNGERFLAQALDSVFAQHYRPLDVIVVDDGSTDGSLRIAESYENVRCFAQEHQNVSAARNRGVAEARGSLVAFLDQDDLWLPEKLAVQSRYLGQRPEIGIVFSRLRNFLEPGETRPPTVLSAHHQPGEWTKLMLGAALVRREVFDLVGVFTSGRGLASDFEWFARARRVGVQLSVLPEVLLLRRLHSRNASNDSGRQQRALLRAVRSLLDAERERVGAS
jgi:glycosyltransferase involved in cell wall biosynthesis